MHNFCRLLKETSDIQTSNFGYFYLSCSLLSQNRCFYFYCLQLQYVFGCFYWYYMFNFNLLLRYTFSIFCFCFCFCFCFLFLFLFLLCFCFGSLLFLQCSLACGTFERHPLINRLSLFHLWCLSSIFSFCSR